MDISLIIFLIIIVVSAYRGYQSGILAIVFRIISLLGAYLVAIMFTVTFASWLQSVSPIRGIISYALAGMSLFAVSSVLFSFIFSLIRRAITNQEPSVDNLSSGDSLSSTTNVPPVSRVSSVTGGIAGALVGVFIAVIAIWFFGTMQTILQAKKGLSPVEKSPFQQKVKQLAASAIKGLAGNATKQQDLVKGGALLLADPAQNIQRFQRLSQSSNLQDLLLSNAGRRALETKNPQTLMALPAFQSLVNNPDLIAVTKELALPDEPSEMRKQVAIKIITLWTQVKQVQNNPEFIAILNDPEIKQIQQSGNIYQLLNSAKIEALLKIISSVEVSGISFNENNFSTNKPTSIYRWVDEKGVVHYSDEKRIDKNEQ